MPIARSAGAVYDFASVLENLPAWATGLGEDGRREGDEWVAATPAGEVRVRFVEQNPFGVLDHYVTVAGGIVYSPMRGIPNGDGAEISFTLFRLDSMTPEAFEADAELVHSDLVRLKQLLEG